MTQSTDNSSAALIRQAVAQIMWYPVILFVSYLFLVAVKVCALTERSFSNTAQHLMVLSGGHGFLFSLVYLALPSVRQHWKLLFFSMYGSLCMTCLPVEPRGDALGEGLLSAGNEAEGQTDGSTGGIEKGKAHLSSHNVLMQRSASSGLTDTLVTSSSWLCTNGAWPARGCAVEGYVPECGGSSSEDDAQDVANYSNGPRSTLSTDSSLDSLLQGINEYQTPRS